MLRHPCKQRPHTQKAEAGVVPGRWDGHSWRGWPQALPLQQPLCSLIAHPLHKAPATGQRWAENTTALLVAIQASSKTLERLPELGFLLPPRARRAAGGVGLLGKSKLGEGRVLHAEPTPNLQRVNIPPSSPPITPCFMPMAELPRSPHCPNEVSFLLQDLQ